MEINASTFYKHLSLIKKAGFRIRRSDDVYKLTRFKKLFNFAKYELNIFTYLLLVVYILLPQKKAQNFIGAVDKMLSLSNKEETLSVEKEYETNRMAAISQYYSEKIAALNKYLNVNKKITIVSKESKEYHINPIEFFWQKDKLYLKFLEEKTLKNIILDDVVKVIEVKKERTTINPKEIIFELYGKLSKSYLLKEEERIIDYSRDKIVIATVAEDKMKLFRRLLRYDILCRVVFPKVDAKLFREMIEKSLDNIS